MSEKDKPSTEKKEPVPEPFAVALQRIDEGSPLDEATRLLHELIAAVRENRKKGSVTLVVEVAPIAKDVADQVTVKVGVKASIPSKAKPGTHLYIGRDGNLSTVHPMVQQQASLWGDGISSVYGTTTSSDTDGSTEK